ncbi:DUF6199 family natural product biosynthesis protein [Paenibacillus sp. sgz500958]|uniref:DUF6199 family natural product biosynthesis protein n=1 Tax=Paenibacillus sp. sgz500958 TaxID=3242475 RepID=UPI0036D30848
MGMPEFVMIVPAIFLGIWVLMCVATIINPRLVWKVTQSWKAIREPHPAYFWFARIMAIIFLLVASALFFPVFYH